MFCSHATQFVNNVFLIRNVCVPHPFDKQAPFKGTLCYNGYFIEVRMITSNIHGNEVALN